MPELLRLTAFTLDESGGNPASVWLGEALPEPTEMLRIPAEVVEVPDPTGRIRVSGTAVVL